MDAAKHGRLTRRGVAKAGAGLAAGLAAARMGGLAALARQASDALPEFGALPEGFAGSGQVRLESWGGSMAAAQQEACLAAFTELTGIEVVPVEGVDLAAVKAAIDAGEDPGVDLLHEDNSIVRQAVALGDYLEPIDYALVDVDAIDEARRGANSLEFMSYGMAIGYRTDLVPEPPAGQADFWDLERFPGARWTPGSTLGAVTPFLEAALIAQGVALDALYPLDVDAAMAGIARLEEAGAVFWTVGQDPIDALKSGAAPLVHGLSGRLAVAAAEGHPIGICWNEAMVIWDALAVPKGAPNRENAMKLLAFMALPEAQARQSALIPYGFVNRSAAALLPAERLAVLPGAQDGGAAIFDRDLAWWGENRALVNARWRTDFGA